MFAKQLCAAAVCAAFALPAWADKVYETDLVVVGAGTSGTVAAVSAVEGGLKVVMLEKNLFAGGAGNYMEGSFAAESFMQKKAGIKLTKTEAFNRMAAYHHWRINAPLVKKFVDLSGDTIQWVWDHGVHWKEVKTAWRDNPVKTGTFTRARGLCPRRWSKSSRPRAARCFWAPPPRSSSLKTAPSRAW